VFERCSRGLHHLIIDYAIVLDVLLVLLQYNGEFFYAVSIAILLYESADISGMPLLCRKKDPKCR